MARVRFYLRFFTNRIFMELFQSFTVNTRYRHTRCRHTKNHFVPITSYDVIQNADVSGGGIIVLDGGSGHFPAHNIFSTLKHGVASLRGNLYRKWSFLLVARSLKCLGLNLYLELEKRLECN